MGLHAVSVRGLELLRRVWLGLGSRSVPDVVGWRRRLWRRNWRRRRLVLHHRHHAEVVQTPAAPPRQLAGCAAELAGPAADDAARPAAAIESPVTAASSAESFRAPGVSTEPLFSAACGRPSQADRSTPDRLKFKIV